VHAVGALPCASDTVISCVGADGHEGEHASTLTGNIIDTGADAVVTEGESDEEEEEEGCESDRTEMETELIHAAAPMHAVEGSGAICYHHAEETAEVWVGIKAERRHTGGRDACASVYVRVYTCVCASVCVRCMRGWPGGGEGESAVVDAGGAGRRA
jgi:hypothetical protein